MRGISLLTSAMRGVSISLPRADENEFIRLHGYDQFGKWHLGINDEKHARTKGRYEFPYGDFANVHRCALLSAESRAGQYKHSDIEEAGHHLHEMIDAVRR